MIKVLSSILRPSLSFFCLLAALPVSAEPLPPCAPTAELFRLDEARLNYLKSSANSGKAIAVLPFRDIHGYEPEPVLPDGIPFAVYDMFSDGNPVVHPYVSRAAANGLNLAGESLTDPARVASVADELQAGFVLFGSIQRSTPSEVRVIVYAYNARKRAYTSPAAQFSTGVNDAFFDLLRRNVAEVVKRAGGSLRVTPYRDPTMASFRYYVRASQLAERHDTVNLNLAVPWYEKALADNNQNYDDSALGLARAHFMKALIARLSHGDDTQDMIAGRRALGFLRGDSSTPRYRLATRYGDGHAAFVAALAALKAGDAKLATSGALRSLSLTPEDGMAEAVYWKALEGTKTKPRIDPFAPVCP